MIDDNWSIKENLIDDIIHDFSRTHITQLTHVSKKQGGSNELHKCFFSSLIGFVKERSILSVTPVFNQMVCTYLDYMSHCVNRAK